MKVVSAGLEAFKTDQRTESYSINQVEFEHNVPSRRECGEFSLVFEHMLIVAMEFLPVCLQFICENVETTSTTA